MLMVKIYAIVNPTNDDVIYIGASTNPKIRYYNHSTGKSWKGKDYTHRQQEILKMKSAGIAPELLILDTVDFPKAAFFEEFYLELFKGWGFKIQQQMRSGYQTNKRFFNDEETVYIPEYGLFGIVVHNEEELTVKVFIEATKRVMSFAPYELQTMQEYNEQNN